MLFAYCLVFALGAGANPPVMPDETTGPHKGLYIHPLDADYPLDLVAVNPKLSAFKVKAPRIPWYVKKADQTQRIFVAGGLQSESDKWDPLGHHLFLQDLDRKGARGIASEYKKFTIRQLERAETELRRVKAEP